MKTQQKSISERIVHAIGFEIIALILLTPVAAWALNKPLFQTGLLAILLSTAAMIWNMAYNAAFDRYYPITLQSRSLKIRLIHACGFEAGLIAICLPIAVAVLDITLLQAFMVELGFFIFMFPYTIAYNWGFDRLRNRWFARSSLSC